MSETLTNQLSADFLILRIKQLEEELEALKEESFSYYRRLCEVTVERDSAEKEREELRESATLLNNELGTYRDALFNTGCHDLFCAEYARNCHKCGEDRSAAKYRNITRQTQDIRRNCGNSD